MKSAWQQGRQSYSIVEEAPLQKCAEYGCSRNKRIRLVVAFDIRQKCSTLKSIQMQKVGILCSKKQSSNLNIILENW